MSSGEKILSSIKKESEERIAALTEDADEVYDEAIKKAEKQAEEIRHNGEHKVQLQSEKLLKAYKSRAELERRNSLLKTKRELIEKAFGHIYECMLSLNDDEYFELVSGLASSLGEINGTVYFNSRDLRRLPKDFAKTLGRGKNGIEISQTPDDGIDGGFILKNGDIEENMTFSAVLSDRHEEIEDMISRELFRD